MPVHGPLRRARLITTRWETRETHPRNNRADLLRISKKYSPLLVTEPIVLILLVTVGPRQVHLIDIFEIWKIDILISYHILEWTILRLTKLIIGVAVVAVVFILPLVVVVVIAVVLVVRLLRFLCSPKWFEQSFDGQVDGMVETSDTVDSIKAVVGVGVKACSLSIVGAGVVSGESKDLSK